MLIKGGKHEKKEKHITHKSLIILLGLNIIE